MSHKSDSAITATACAAAALWLLVWVFANQGTVTGWVAAFVLAALAAAGTAGVGLLIRDQAHQETRS